MKSLTYNRFLLICFKVAGTYFLPAILLITYGATSEYGFLCIIITLIVLVFYEFKLINKEVYWGGNHTSIIQISIRTSFLLFLVIETIVFFSFFWSYFHYSLVEIWPPKGIIKCSPFSLPLLNTCLLLTSALSLTAFHASLMKNKDTKAYLWLTVVLGALFIGFQYSEYRTHLAFSLSDGIYGSTFYSLTGFHGLHVTLGIGILIVTNSITTYAMDSCHIGALAAIWYWHFVDVIWILLYFFIYVY